MSFNKMRNAMMTLAGLQVSNFGFATTGVVAAIDNVKNLIQVRISEVYGDQEALQTGWIPVASPWSGNGFGFFSPPGYNDLVLLIFAEGDYNNAVAALRIFNDQDVPLNVPSGECWIVHATGSFIQLTNDGKLGLNGNVEIDLTAPQVNITCTTQCQISSPSVQIGNLSGPLHKLINDTLITLFNNHIHPTPSGNSSPPVTPLTSANATTIVEAN